MASDDIALDGGQVKIFFGALKSKKGVFEPMKAVTRIGIMPVVEKVRLFGGFCGRDSGIGPAQRAKTTIWN